MKRFVLFLQLYLIATLASYGTNKIYNDAFIFGTLYGNPAEITVLTKDGFNENSVTYRFDEQGALTYHNGSVKNLIRDEKGRLISYETELAGHVIEWGQSFPVKRRLRSLLTKLVIDEFIDTNYTYEFINGHDCRTRERGSTIINKNGRKENTTLTDAKFQNTAFDEYGNVKFQIMHYIEDNGANFADETILTTIKYWPDRMTDIGDISQRHNTFKDMIFSLSGFTYNPANKRNLAQQLFDDYIYKSGLQHIAHQFYDEYKDSSNKYYEIPYDAIFQRHVGGARDYASIDFEFRGTEHEIKELEKEFLQHLNALGMNMISDGKEYRSSSQITVAHNNKKKLSISYATLVSKKESGHDKALLRLGISLSESKIK